MEELVVNLEIAKLLHELEYDEECLYLYDEDDNKVLSLVSIFEYTGDLFARRENIEDGLANDYECYLAPTREQVLKWLRNNFNLHIFCNLIQSWAFHIHELNNYGKPIYDRENNVSIGRYETYEEALEEGIKYCLTKIIKQ